MFSAWNWNRIVPLYRQSNVLQERPQILIVLHCFRAYKLLDKYYQLGNVVNVPRLVDAPLTSLFSRIRTSGIPGPEQVWMKYV